MLYFSDAIPRGLKLEPEKVLQLRRNFLMLNLVLIVMSWTFAMFAEGPMDGAVGLLCMGPPTFWFLGIMRKGVRRECLEKRPTDSGVSEGLDSMLREHPSIGAYVSANQLRSTVSIFELELLMAWAFHEKRQLAA